MNSNESKKKTVVCYGEVLWDVFPNHTKPGGAPMNVAYHLSKFSINSRMISRVGTDELGEKLLSLLSGWNIPTENCGQDSTFKTGMVEATVQENNEMSYKILQDVAWDNIVITEADEKLVTEADAFVFGSLVTRHSVSRATLYHLIEKAKYKVFDVNLRPPFYDHDVIEYLMYKCNLMKLNQAELELIISWFGFDIEDEARAVQFIREKFDIAEIIVTRGSEGATYYDGQNVHFFPAFEVSVKDTVGSGDSFLAAFLALKIQGVNIENAMLNATALGAFVASKEGACPPYELSQLESFISEKQQTITINK